LEAKKKDFTFFVGAVGQSYSTPYFSGVAAKDFGTGFQYTKKFEPATGKKKSGCRGVGCYTNHGTFELSTVVAYTGNKPTALQGVVYHWRGLQLQGTAGLLEKRTYFTGQSTLRFQHFSFDVGRQTFIWQGKRSTVTSGSASLWLGPVNAHTSVYRSQNAAGENAGTGLRLGPVQVNADAFFSRQHSLTGSVIEKLSRRFSISQFVTRSAGHTAVNFGGSYTSNLVTASVSYQQQFIPFGKVPFQKVLSLTLAFQLPHGTTVNVATVAAPNGGTKVTAYGGTYVEAPWLPSAAQGRGGGRAKIGGVVVRGKVSDAYGPIEGAAVEVGGQLVYTNTEGVFEARFKKNREVSVRVVPEEFSTPGNWECVSCPASVTPGTPIQITVRRKP